MNRIQNYGMINYQLSNNSPAFKSKRIKPMLTEKGLADISKKLKTGEMINVVKPDQSGRLMSHFEPNPLLAYTFLASGLAGAISATDSENKNK